jgi:hypothetical protein
MKNIKSKYIIKDNFSDKINEEYYKLMELSDGDLRHI